VERLSADLGPLAVLRDLDPTADLDLDLPAVVTA
jgi:hypothetical protein